MKYVLVILILALLFCMIGVMVVLFDAMDYDPAWDEPATEENENDDTGRT